MKGAKIKPTQTGSEIAAAIIAAAGTEVKTLDSLLQNYFYVLSKIMNSAEDERWPHIASHSTK
jgi:hypothetical protein